MINYIILDIETNSEEKFGRTANFIYNDIIAFSLKTQDFQLTHYVYDKADIEDMISIICKYDVLVAFSAKFECLYLWEYDQFQKWLQLGGKIWCPQLAEYYISNYKDQCASLRNTAVNKYECKERIKWLDQLLFKNKMSFYKDVDELPIDKVLEDVENDVLDTESIYCIQQELIDQRGQIFRNLIKNQMELLLSTSEIEYNGFKI